MGGSRFERFGSWVGGLSWRQGVLVVLGLGLLSSTVLVALSRVL